MPARKHNIGPLKDCVLLYVEDDDATAYLFQTALAESGIDVVYYRVSDAESALQFLCRHGAYESAPFPDLLVLDLNLPRVSGTELLERVRSHPQLRDIPAVVFSSSGLDFDRERSKAAGADDYFVKETDLTSFMATVRTICERLPSGPVLRSA